MICPNGERAHEVGVAWVMLAAGIFLFN